ncbi:MAG: S8 family serine peptidase, partial [Erysipelotrichaceae bacterium]|nr:S8 family serine peptidase [Erysipelotrichaceae bacterium]
DGRDKPLQLEPGTYVEGEVLVLAADPEMTAFSARENSLLDSAEDLMEIESGLDHPMTAYSNGRRDSDEPEKIKGTIKLVKNSSMSTKDLIEALYEDPRVIYAEPNYILTTAGDENEASKNISEPAGKETSKEESDSKKDSSQKEEADKKDDAAEEEGTSKKDESDAKDDSSKKEEAASESNESSAEKKENGKQTEEKLQAKAEDGKELVPSSFGPSAYTSGRIPDMTQWQWGNWNNGEMAGTYTHEGTADIQYDAWKSQIKESMPEYVIGVLDMGIDESNPDLSPVLWTGDVYGPGGDSHGCFGNTSGTAGGTSTTELVSGHGTHVAGIIAADWNGQGISGVASNAKLMSLRFESSFASVISCLNYAKEAVKKGVNMIAVNNSWTMGSVSTDLINLAVTELGELGVVSVFASGNDATSMDQTLGTSTTLANNPYAVIVDSANPNAVKAPYSNFGIGTTEVMAPGSNILSTYLNNENTLSFNGEINAHAPEG